jgi:pimeloyl-ACP methyl ester carboxylesterase
MSFIDSSSLDSHPRQRRRILDAEMCYVDTGHGDPTVFLHGNPTSSYLWRNVIPFVSGLSRCFAPDLIGMGRSSPASVRGLRFAGHARYLDAWFDQLNLDARAIARYADPTAGVAAQWMRLLPGYALEGSARDRGERAAFVLA